VLETSLLEVREQLSGLGVRAEPPAIGALQATILCILKRLVPELSAAQEGPHRNRLGMVEQLRPSVQLEVR
jgi:hypothetical protein